jgi:hypothetical protein
LSGKNAPQSNGADGLVLEETWDCRVNSETATDGADVGYYNCDVIIYPPLVIYLPRNATIAMQFLKHNAIVDS